MYIITAIIMGIIDGLIAIGDGVKKILAAVFLFPFRLISTAFSPWTIQQKKSRRKKKILEPQWSKLPKIYYSSLKEALRFAMPFIRFSYLKKLLLMTLIPFQKANDAIHTVLWKLRVRMGPRASKKRPLTVYPAPLHLAWRFQSFFLGVCAALFFVFLPYVYTSWMDQLPSPILLSARSIPVATKIYDRSGTVLYEIYADENRTPLPLHEIPDIVQKATIAIEDREFYTHPGFSLRGIARAANETLRNDHLQGGSTITQQLIKSALLTPEITITRKLKELVLSLEAERIYSKNQILEMYLNQVPYGGTAWGIESASRMYFGKSVKDLTLNEAALLAGLPAAPSTYSPFGAKPDLAIVRQREVLRRMRDDGYISEDQYNTALDEPIVYRQQDSGIKAPHFVMFVKDLLEKRYGARLIQQGGLRVVTSLDSDIQTLTEQTVSRHISALKPLNVGNGAALVTNPTTGEILAMVGSANYFDYENDGNVNVSTRLRQPGSSIKVVNYAAALENGFSAATLINDSPITYKIPGSEPYTPVNYDGRYHGTVTLRSALANSYNIPAVKTLAKIGVKTMVETGIRMGITESWNNPTRFGLSLTLGGGDVTMIEMAQVYGTLSNKGVHRNLMPILEVSDYTGRVIDKFTPDAGLQAIRTETAWIISNILSDNSARTPAFGPRSDLVIPGKTVSVKTGTSNDKRDNWTIGYTPEILTAVWVGNNDNSPMNPTLTSGVTGASPIWHDIMNSLLADKQDNIPEKPPGVVEIPCYGGKKEYFTKGTEPAGNTCRMPPATPTPQET